MAKSARRAGAPAPGRRGKDAEFEVEDQTAPQGPSAGLETGLIFVTFAALLVGVVLAQIELGSTFGRGLFG